MERSTSTTSSSRAADSALSDHFSHELAGVEGRSRSAFLAALEQEATATIPRFSTGRRLLIGTLLAAAASLAFGFGIWSARTVNPAGPLASGSDLVPREVPDIPDGEGGDADSTFQTLAYDPSDLRPVTPVSREQWWQARDAGTYVIDGEPVRAVQRREWERTWFRNAAGYEVTIERPREQWMLVDADIQ